MLQTDQDVYKDTLELLNYSYIMKMIAGGAAV